MDSPALKTFQRKMANPIHWRLVNRTLQEYSKAELETMAGATRFINTLADALNITLSKSEQRQAATWLSGQHLDPNKKRDRLRIWKSVKTK